MRKRKGFRWAVSILGIGLFMFLVWYLPALIHKIDCQRKYNEKYQYWYEQKLNYSRNNRFGSAESYARKYAESEMEYSTESADLRNASMSCSMILVPTIIVFVIGGFVLFVTYKNYKDSQARADNRSRLSTILNSNPTIIIQKAELGHHYDVWHDGYFDSDNRWHKGYSSTLWGSGPNNAHGWSYIISWVSGYEKNIKYCLFKTKAFNSVGDPAYSETSGKAAFDLKVVGPITRGSYQESLWENLIYYNASIRMEIQSIDVIFMDGTSVTIEKNNIVRRNDLPKLNEM